MLVCILHFGRIADAKAIHAPAARSHSRGRLSIAAFIGILVAGASVKFDSLTAPEAANHVIFVDPLLLPGKEFPLLSYLLDADKQRLLGNNLTMILFSHDCDHCRAYLDSFSRTAPEAEQRSTVWIDIARGDMAPLKNQISISPAFEYIANVPVRLRLNHGIIHTVDHPLGR